MGPPVATTYKKGEFHFKIQPRLLFKINCLLVDQQEAKEDLVAMMF